MTGDQQPRRRPTQADVARAAGVSQTAVSYILNDKPSATISDATRRRVLQVIEELGYVPDLTARSLRSRRTMTIGAIIPDITNPFFTEFVRGVQDVARTSAYDVITSNTDGLHDLEHNAVSAARRGRVDGLITATYQLTAADLDPTLAQGTPVVVLGEPDDLPLPEDAPFDRVYVPGDEGARAVTAHLVERGHRRIAVLAGTRHRANGEARVAGYRRALAAAGITVDEDLVGWGDWSESSGHALMTRLLELEPARRPTAVFAGNDLMAVGALLACKTAGLRVPEDMAIAGYDNVALAHLVMPPLTTLDQHPRRIGTIAADLLLDRLTGRYAGPSRVRRAAFDLVVRESA
ncbi:MAG TPA: LacI family DNA-binding transcriptional regulator [Thermomicrobiales bacterium]|jgi:LacI family transcriptional regulator|nr:LacI family DNA-binding transcriptional regulator [Thermomicrobiales bacterium]